MLRLAYDASRHPFALDAQTAQFFHDAELVLQCCVLQSTIRLHFYSRDVVLHSQQAYMPSAIHSAHVQRHVRHIGANSTKWASFCLNSPGMNLSQPCWPPAQTLQ